MAIIPRSNLVSPDTTTIQFAPQITGLLAGAPIDAGSPCYIASADGRVYMCDGTAANEAANPAGFAPRNALAGEPITLFGHGSRFNYGTGLVPGTRYYLATTAGQLDDAPTAGDALGVAQAITTTDIRIVRDN